MELHRCAAPLAALAFLTTAVPGGAATGVSEPLVTARVSIALTSPIPISDGQLRAMTREAEAIWLPYGVALTWLTPRAASSAPPTGIRLQAAFVNPDRSTKGVGNSGAISLGAIQFLDVNTANNVIRLSADEIATRVLSTQWNGRPLNSLPPAVMDDLSGRALGRVLAHEIGHYLLGLRTHTETGLMRPSYGSRELAGWSNESFHLDAETRLRLRSRLAVCSACGRCDERVSACGPPRGGGAPREVNDEPRSSSEWGGPHER